MFDMTQTLIIVYKNEMILNQLKKLIETKDDNEEEVILYYYNMFPGEVKIYKGDTLAIGVFQKVAVGNNDNTETKVSLDKN